MATTILQAVNRVLRLIGEDEVTNAATSLTQEYPLLVLAYMNEIKDQIEEAHNWRALRSTQTTTILAQAQSATITGATESSRLVRIYQGNRAGQIPLVFDMSDTSNPDPLIEMDLAEIIYRDAINPNQYNEPTFFALDNSAGDSMELFVWDRPSGDTDIQTTLIIPQPRLSEDALSTNISIPIRPLITGTAWYCLEDRGEELGPNGMFSEQRFRDSLSDAIARDAAEQGDNMELISV